MIDRERVIDKVAEKTHGTEGDPLAREEVAQVVNATLDVLYAEGAINAPDAEPEPAVEAEAEEVDE